MHADAKSNHKHSQILPNFGLKPNLIWTIQFQTWSP